MIFKTFIPGIAWFFLVLILICLPGDDLPQADNWMTAVYFDKWVHAGIFSVLGFLFMYPFCISVLPAQEKLSALLKITVAVSLWGLTTECIQKFIPGRSFDWWDWVADSFGGLIALWFSRKRYTAK